MQQGRAPQGMRVKLRCKLGECRRHGIAKPRVQETATAGSGTLGSRMSSRPALEGRHNPVCFALPGLDLTRSHPGLRPLRVLRPGLCCTALSALVTISVSLTRMPHGAFFSAPSEPGVRTFDLFSRLRSTRREIIVFEAFFLCRLCVLRASAVKLLIILQLLTYNRKWIVLLDLGHSLH